MALLARLYDASRDRILESTGTSLLALGDDKQDAESWATTFSDHMVRRLILSQSQILLIGARRNNWKL